MQHGVTGRVDVADGGAAEGDEVEEPPLPPLHQEAYDAIERGDLDAAAAAYQQALKQNPADADAELGLAQVGLMQRTEGADLQAARAAAAEQPTDVAAQTPGRRPRRPRWSRRGRVPAAHRPGAGHQPATSASRPGTTSLQLFAVVGSHDERVRKARTALMSALF